MSSTLPEVHPAVRAYLDRNPAELPAIAPLLGGQPSCSAVVADRDGRILQLRPEPGIDARCPGGRPAPGDRGPVATALRALRAWTRLPPEALSLTARHLDVPVHIAPVVIGPGPLGAELRFLFHLLDAVALPPGCEWRTVDALPDPALRARLQAEPPGPAEAVNASALIHDGAGRYLLHLRDDLPDIWAPGEFGLPGGGREGGDRSAEDTLRRELAEELPGLRLGQVLPLTVERARGQDGLTVPVQVFAAAWEGDPRTLGLREGVLVRWFRPAELGRLRLQESTRELILRHAAAAGAVAPGRVPGVRRAVPEDAAALAGLRAAGATVLPGWLQECAERFADRLAHDPRTAAFVREDGAGEPVACAWAEYRELLPEPGRPVALAGEVVWTVAGPDGATGDLVAAAEGWLAAVGVRRAPSGAGAGLPVRHRRW
ncbi:NUDIX domain-containing protein [Streptomyces sp. TLI_171]|uniref:NUDIX domain-containing protein n=1 Tax=Streptomyces sp. TLI_171 TaxID=1938859 RepID=UPI0015D53235|nr:NUDIX hydrolase [Streptomyces sp. TLI_171]